MFQTVYSFCIIFNFIQASENWTQCNFESPLTAIRDKYPDAGLQDWTQQQLNNDIVKFLLPEDDKKDTKGKKKISQFY